MILLFISNSVTDSVVHTIVIMVLLVKSQIVGAQDQTLKTGIEDCIPDEPVDRREMIHTRLNSGDECRWRRKATGRCELTCKTVPRCSRGP